MIRLIFLFIIVCMSCNQRTGKYPVVLIETRYGDIEVELYPDKAPVTVAAFLSYVDAGYYNKSSFYRVLKADELPNPNNFGIIQGGIWKSRPDVLVSIPGIRHESTTQTGLTHQSGTISLARTRPGTASTEFFICIGGQNQFDAGQDGTEDRQGFAAFGKVIKGMPVVRKIQEQSSRGDQFENSIPISATRHL
jgi:peptidyl-prolyl cis-trans isomerase A (cyclophilin A)